MSLTLPQILVVIVYLIAIGYLGFLGYRRTKTAADYLIAGRQIHPFIMALSYGATFISTSAIVGFGGVAGMFGMSLLWLTFLNIFVGIFVAFVFLGGPTRRMGHRLDAHTFPELIGRRYDSKFIQVFAGLVIFLFMPLYAAAVLIGGCAFIASQFGTSYEIALLVFSVLIAAYVVMGGLKGVMYTDALQGSVMFIGMIILLIASYSMVGGVAHGHEQLTELGKAPSLFGGLGFKGWTSMPQFGWGALEVADKAPNPDGYNLWWIIVSTITLGVGIGVLAQPQLAVRFMTVKSKKQLNRAVLVGGIFILIMTGVAFTVGSLSNLYFAQREVVKGKLLGVSGAIPPKPENMSDEEWKNEVPKHFAWVIAKQERGLNLDKDGQKLNKAVGPDDKSVPCTAHVDTIGDGAADTHLIYKGHGGAAAVTPAAEITGLEKGADPTPLIGEDVEARPNATAYLRAIVKNRDGTYQAMTSRIIPFYINSAMPRWFGLLFLLTLLAAAMSTLSSQFHALGTSIGRDVYEACRKDKGQSITITRIGILVGIILAVLISYFNQGGGYIIARATSIFFGLCASAFLPAFVGGLFFKRMTKPAAIYSMVVGLVVTAFWLLFIKDQEARAIGFCHWLTGKYSLLVDSPSWPVVDPLVIALPLSVITAIVVAFLTKPPADEHLAKCFGSGQKKG